jgi:hypothetical protein
MTFVMNTAKVELAEYFDSIRDDFKATLEQRGRSEKFSGLMVVFALSITLSVVPLIPLILYLISRWMKFSYSFHGYALPLQSFWFWWTAAAAFFIIATFVFIKLRPKPDLKADEQLSKSQMRFAIAFALAEELSDFQKNGRQTHIHRALDLESNLYSFLPAILSPIAAQVYEQRLMMEAGGRRITSNLLLEDYRRFDWFKLDPATDRILQAFHALHSKIHDRIKDKKDLTLIIEMLNALALYFYTEIPEKQTADKAATNDAKAVGLGALLKFADILEPLQPYDSERSPATVEEKIQKRVSVKFERLGALFVHPNLVVCFIAWLTLLTAVVVAGVLTAMHYLPNLNMDSTIVALLIGVPIASAATLTALARHKIDGSK